MFKLFKCAGATAAFVLATSCANYAPIAVDEATFTRQQVAADLDAFIDFVKATHPNIEHTADPAEIDATAARVRAALRDGMTSREAWVAMAVMNPTFKDAHVGLRRSPASLTAFEQSRESLFPAAVIINEKGVIRIATSEFESVGVERGDEVLSINGIAAKGIVDTLAPRMRGNSPALGRLIMERCFLQYF